MKRVRVITPSGKKVFHKKREKSKLQTCAGCGQVLHGVPRAVSSEMKNFSKTERGPNRIFGGQYCGGCTKGILREKARIV